MQPGAGGITSVFGQPVVGLPFEVVLRNIEQRRPLPILVSSSYLNDFPRRCMCGAIDIIVTSIGEAWLTAVNVWLSSSGWISNRVLMTSVVST